MGLELSLAAAALLIGATGTFSPCGFSAVETIGPTGHTGGRRITLAACATFVPGAVVGGVLTFGALALAGEALHGAGGPRRLLRRRGDRGPGRCARGSRHAHRPPDPPPAARALAPRDADAAGGGALRRPAGARLHDLRPLASGSGRWRGSASRWATPSSGLLLGLAFGLGRALPVVALAPLAGTPAGARATELMASNPAVYLGVRRGDAAALAVAALALTLSVGQRRRRRPVGPERRRPLGDGGLARVRACRRRRRSCAAPASICRCREATRRSADPTWRPSPARPRGYWTGTRWRRSSRCRPRARTRSPSRRAGWPTAPS